MVLKSDKKWKLLWKITIKIHFLALLKALYFTLVRRAVVGVFPFELCTWADAWPGSAHTVGARDGGVDGGEGLAKVGVGGGGSVEMSEALTRRGGFTFSLTFLLQDLIVSSVLMAFGWKYKTTLLVTFTKPWLSAAQVVSVTKQPPALTKVTMSMRSMKRTILPNRWRTNIISMSLQWIQLNIRKVRSWKGKWRLQRSRRKKNEVKLPHLFFLNYPLLRVNYWMSDVHGRILDDDSLPRKCCGQFLCNLWGQWVISPHEGNAKFCND